MEVRELRIMTSPKADPPNPAMPSLFQCGRRRRRVGDPRRWASLPL